MLFRFVKKYEKQVKSVSQFDYRLNFHNSATGKNRQWLSKVMLTANQFRFSPDEE